MSKSKKPKATPNANSDPQPADYPQCEKLDLAEIRQEQLQLQGRLPFAPIQPAHEAASGLVELGDWPERWLSLVENQSPNAFAFSPRLSAFKEQTLYLAKHCETLGMDASALVEYARDLQRTYFAFRPDLPAVGDAVWVLLDRLKLRLEPFESEGESKDNKTPPIPKDEANLLVRDYLKESPDATARQTAKALGIAQGRLPGLPAWQSAMSKRKYEKQKQTPKAKQERILSDGMLGAIGTGDDPAEIVAAQDEADARAAAWQSILDEATPEERARLHQLPHNKQTAMCDASLDAQQEERLQRKREQRRQEKLDQR